jgi:hypothetical protein
VLFEFSAMSQYFFFFPVLFYFSCQNNDRQGTVGAPLFQRIAPEHSGIDFNNFIMQNRTVNYLTSMQIYSCAGHGIVFEKCPQEVF